METIITNARVVLKDAILPKAAVMIRDGIILHIAPECNLSLYPQATVYDAQGMLLLPGMIDLHSDAIEKEIEPRPGTHFPVELAIAQLEKRLVSQGFTTVFHSLSFAGGDGIRDDETARTVIQQIKKRTWSVLRNRVHLRYEITNFESLPVVKELLNSGMVDLFSIMDHAPGQGQYQTMEDYANYVRKTYHRSESEIEAIAAERIRRRAEIAPGFLEELVKMAADRSIPVASHDDDSVARIDWEQQVGIGISEFPINMATAARAAAHRMYVIVGAPNIARGGSHNGNLAASDLIRARYANLICSDYYPGSMLYAVFKTAGEIARERDGLVEAVKMVSLNPARALGQDHCTGSIENGKLADLILVEPSGEYPVVKKTFIQGKLVYSGNYWNEALRAEVS